MLVFKTERNCRQQFQIWWKWQKVIQIGKKTRKRRNCLLQAVSPFRSVFKRLVLRTCKNQVLFWKGSAVILSGPFWKILQKKKNHDLTHYQTTNFRLFQTERVCRRQFQIWRKWQKVIQTGRKQCGKRRNCSLRAISPFSKVFSKGLFPRGIKRCHCVGMG